MSGTDGESPVEMLDNDQWVKTQFGSCQLGYSRVYLEVTAQNNGAIRLYRRLGFRQTKVVFKATEVRDVELASA